MSKRYPHFLVSLLVLLLLLGSCQPKESAGRITADNYLTAIPDPKTLGEAYVSDPNSLLQPGTAAALNAQLASLDQSGRAHIDVVLVQSIGEEVPKTAATALFNQWKIGDKEKNNGLLMLLVMDQHRVEFETGYGLEGDLPDVTCFRIQQQYMIPELKAERTDAAVQAGVDALIRELAGSGATTSGSPELLVDTLAVGPEMLQPDMAVQPEAVQEVPDVAYSEEDAVGQAMQSEPTEWPGLLGALATLVVAAGGIWLTFRNEEGMAGLLVMSLGALALVALVAAYFSLLAQLYLLPLVATHLLFFNKHRRTLTPEWQALSRQQQYEQLVESHNNLGFTAYLFPLVLVWYWRWHRRRLAHLRDDPYTCPTCAQPMHKLDATAEKPYLKPGEQVEEEVESYDYDVWQCTNGHLLQLPYHNPSSPAEKCKACHYETLLLTSSQEVVSATTSHSGWGWRNYECKACHHTEKEKYTVARISESSSSGSSSGSSSSSSSSSSGGSSGGGGAGSSW